MAKGKEQIHSEIEDTRQRVGDIMEALIYKVDVKSRARDSLHGVRQGTADAARRTLGVLGSVFSRQRS